jgi:hypothetical protein
VVERRSGPRRHRTPAAAHLSSVPADPGESIGTDHFAVVKIRFELPHTHYLYPFSRAHPDMLIVITATQNLSENRVLAELELVEASPSDRQSEMEALKGVISVSRLGPVGPHTRIQGIAERPSFLVLADQLEVLCRYPRFVRNGEHTMEVASRVSQLRKLVHGLRAISPEVTIAAFGRDRMRTIPPSLTTRQSALLHQALAAGYFDVPRRISLTGFAHQLGRSKSSMSRALALIEKTLAEGTVARMG